MSAAREDLILKYAVACKRNAAEMAGMPISVICQHFREFADELAALSTEPGEAALHYECASAGCERPATVHFIRADVGSYYCRECYMRIQAIPATRQALESDNG